MKKYIFILLSIICFSTYGQDVNIMSFGGVVTPLAQNLVKYSEQLDNAAWTKTGTITADQAVDLAGNTTIDLNTNIGNAGKVQQVGITVTPSTDYVLSLDAKLGTSNYIAYVIYDNTNFAYIVNTTEYEALLNTSTFTRVSFPFTTPTGCVSLMIRISADWVTGTTYLGRIQIATPGKAYITTTNAQVN